MKLNSVKDPFEISKRPFHIYNIFALWWPKEWENVCLISREARALFYKHRLLQLMISLKLELEMKFCEIPIWADENTFQMNYSRLSKTSCRVYGSCSKFVICAVAMCKNMCSFKWSYLKNQEMKWNSPKYSFEMTKKLFTWDMVDPPKHPIDSVTSL
jgi:hypothetical protein